MRQEHPLSLLLQAAGLAPSTFHYQVKVMASVSDADEGLASRIRALFDRHHQRYGYRRITAALRQAGERVNHKLVQRLMGEMGLKSPVRARKRFNTYRGDAGKVAPNTLKRKFTAKRPNTKWVTDITEFKVAGEKLYLSPVMDLYNGEIIAYEINRRPLFAMVQSMLGKALKRLRPGDKPLLHSDQGWHYRQLAYQSQLTRYSIRQSMSRKATCLDNAAMESFFGTLKSEYFYLNQFDNVDELARGVEEYIHYYNHERIKLKLNSLSPVQYRTRAYGP